MLGVITALYVPVEHIRKTGSNFLTWLVALSLLVIIYAPGAIVSRINPNRTIQQIILRVMKITVMTLILLQIISIVFGRF
jgi:hypothetical protein